MSAPSPGVEPGSHPGATLRINEIFHSIQGESTRAGLPTTFVRLTGCPLRCDYCDTVYAYDEGEIMTLDAVLESVRAHGAKYVTVTGGEPLAQKDCLVLLARLCDGGFDVSLETSGAIDVSRVDPRVVKILDVKTPGSGESVMNRFENLALLGSRDQIKIVICDRADYEWAKALIARERLAERCEVLFSPSHGRLAPGELADWILADRLPVRLQVQLHKVLWGDVRGR
jgi:7-carboxy-7-deazaguanine synthase